LAESTNQKSKKIQKSLLKSNFCGPGFEVIERSCNMVETTNVIFFQLDFNYRFFLLPLTKTTTSVPQNKNKKIGLKNNFSIFLDLLIQ